MDTPTIWLVYSNEPMRDRCAARFEEAGADVNSVPWGPELADLIRKLRPDDWVLFDYQELQQMGPKFADAFKQVLDRARVLVVSHEEVPADELGQGWAELTGTVTCEKICNAIRSLTGMACGDPGCCPPG